MRDYKLKSSGLQPHVYAQVVAIVKGYESMKTEYEDILQRQNSVFLNGQPKGSRIADRTSRDAAKRADLSEKIEAIDQAISSIPEEYRKGIWNNAVHGTPYPDEAHRSTYWRYKAKIFQDIAKRMYWI